eukprot:gb/GECG01007092.1/.p1 GENE.gb/GECG01007092.1/~~gb/GECG01007092.1/.p1  ORF type:complete len:1050 (+),score=160.51 gb/GECG01007092.1/:1-3150(+)
MAENQRAPRIPRLDLRKLQVGKEATFTEETRRSGERGRHSNRRQTDFLASDPTSFASLFRKSYEKGSSSPKEDHRTAVTARATSKRIEVPQRPEKIKKPAYSARAHVGDGRGRSVVSCSRGYPERKGQSTSRSRPVVQPSNELRNVLNYAYEQHGIQDDAMESPTTATEEKMIEQTLYSVRYSPSKLEEQNVYWKPSKEVKSPRFERSHQIRANRAKNLPSLLPKSPRRPKHFACASSGRIAAVQQEQSPRSKTEESSVSPRRVYHFDTSIYERFGLKLESGQKETDNELDRVSQETNCFEHLSVSSDEEQPASDLPPKLSFYSGHAPEATSLNGKSPEGEAKKQLRPNTVSVFRRSEERTPREIPAPRRPSTASMYHEMGTGIAPVTSYDKKLEGSRNRRGSANAKSEARDGRRSRTSSIGRPKSGTPMEDTTLEGPAHRSPRNNFRAGDLHVAKTESQDTAAVKSSERSLPVSIRCYKHSSNIFLEREYFPQQFTDAWRKSFQQLDEHPVSSGDEGNTAANVSPTKANPESLSFFEDIDDRQGTSRSKAKIRARIKSNFRVEDDAEFQRWIAKHGRKKFVKNLQSMMDLLRQWFRWIDADGSGELSVEELTEPLLSLGLASSHQEVRALIHAVKGSLPPDIAAVFAYVHKKSSSSEGTDLELGKLLGTLSVSLEDDDDWQRQQSEAAYLQSLSSSIGKQNRNAAPTVDSLRLRMLTDIELQQQQLHQGSAPKHGSAENYKVSGSRKHSPEIGFSEFVTLLTDQSIVDTAKAIVNVQNQVKYASKCWNSFHRSRDTERQEQNRRVSEPRDGAGRRSSMPRRLSVGDMELDPTTRRLSIDLPLARPTAEGSSSGVQMSKQETTRTTLRLKPRRASYHGIQNLMGSSKEGHNEKPLEEDNQTLQALKDVEHCTKTLDNSSKKHGRTGVVVLQNAARKKETELYGDGGNAGLKNPLTRLFREFMMGRLGDSSLSFPVIISAFRRKRLMRACCGDGSEDELKQVEEEVADRRADKFAADKFQIPQGITMGLAAAKNNLIQYANKHQRPKEQE